MIINYNYMDNIVFIKYQYPSDSKLIGRDDFNDELRKYYIVQDRVVWASHCYELYELWNFQILINNPIIHFMAGAIVSGLFWDELKKILANALEALKRFQEKNENFQISEMTFEFDDITIVLCQSVASDYRLICNFFVNLECLIRLMKANGIDDIYRISYPFNEIFERENPGFIDAIFLEDLENSYIKIDYFDGCETIYYQPSTGFIRDSKGEIIKKIAKFDMIK